MRCASRRLVLFLGLLGLALTGCAGADHTAASKLAEGGQTWSSAADHSVLQIRDGLDTYVESQYLVAGLTSGPQALGEEDLVAIQSMQTSMDLRSAALQQLATAYATFGKLADYDASAEVGKAVGGLNGAVNAYAKQVGSDTNPISESASALASSAAGAIAAADQSRRLAVASRLIREQLELFRDAMAAEQRSYGRVATLIASGQTAAANAMWNSGLGDPSPILRTQLGDVGLEYNRDQVLGLLKSPVIVASNDPPPSTAAGLRKGISGVIKYRAQRQARLIGAVLDETAAGLDALIEEHRSLERGQPLSAATLTQHLEAMRGYVELLAKLKGEYQKPAKTS